MEAFVNQSSLAVYGARGKPGRPMIAAIRHVVYIP
jgi:hypothetical protein